MAQLVRAPQSSTVLALTTRYRVCRTGAAACLGTCLGVWRCCARSKKGVVLDKCSAMGERHGTTDTRHDPAVHVRARVVPGSLARADRVRE